MSVMRQLSLFGVEVAGPEPGDLAGLLAGPAEAVRMGGTARVSIVVDRLWRAAVLVAEFGRRGLAATWEPVGRNQVGQDPAGPERIAVRTAYCTALGPLAGAWLRGTVKHPPRDLMLDGRALRLWVEACGQHDGATSYLLPVGPTEELAWPAVGLALAAAGLRADLVDARGRGPAYRLLGRRRVSRLAEVIGDPPKNAPDGLWPG